jgi:hypothetical protein
VVRERDGATMGATPFRERWPRGSGVERLRIERAGYRSEAVVVPLDRGIDVALALSPLPAPAAAPVPAPVPLPSAPPPARGTRRPARHGGAERSEAVAESLLVPAEEQLSLGRVAEGCALGKTVAGRAPDAAAVWEFLGRCYMRLAKPDEARAYYRKYLALAPDGPRAPFIRAIVERVP